MEKKNEFMLMFRFEPNFSPQASVAEMSDMHQQWGAFIGNLASQEKLVSTHQLSFEGKQVAADKTVREGIHISDNQTIRGNVIVKANTLDQATEIAKNCPVLSMGGSVEVSSIQTM